MQQGHSLSRIRGLPCHRSPPSLPNLPAKRNKQTLCSVTFALPPVLHPDHAHQGQPPRFFGSVQQRHRAVRGRQVRRNCGRRGGGWVGVVGVGVGDAACARAALRAWQLAAPAPVYKPPAYIPSWLLLAWPLPPPAASPGRSMRATTWPSPAPHRCVLWCGPASTGRGRSRQLSRPFSPALVNSCRFPSWYNSGFLLTCGPWSPSE